MSNRGPAKTLMLLSLALIAAASVTHMVTSYRNRPLYPHERARPPVPGMKEVPRGTIEALTEFETHLPIVVVEFEKEPGIQSVWNYRKGYVVKSEDDPYADGFFRLYNNEHGRNRLTDAPSVETKIQARLRGVSSSKFPKKQYQIKMINQDGTRNELDILGMGADWEWVLNISHIDKSLIRNYMCLNIGARIMGYAPETRYCEVFRKRGDDYEYIGVYLLMEPVARGKNRVALTKYNPRYAKTAYLLRRDRFQEGGVVLDTYATVNRLSHNFLEVKYPGRKVITARSVKFIEDDISELERMLYSENRREFLGYRDVLDSTSCADYFIMNEFFANYDSQWNSFYMHKDLNEKLHFGPVWDFDQALGNNAPFELNPQSTAMQNAEWLNKLMSDGKFLYLLMTRYHDLRKGVLSEEYLYRFIDNVTAYLGDAVDRDWNRWRYSDPHSLTYDEKDVLHPNALVIRANHKEELDAMKKVIHEHGTWLDENIDSAFGHFVDLDYE